MDDVRVFCCCVSRRSRVHLVVPAHRVGLQRGGSSLGLLVSTAHMACRRDGYSGTVHQSCGLPLSARLHASLPHVPAPPRASPLPLHAQVHFVATSRDARRQGHCRAMLEAWEEWAAADLGVRTVVAHASRDALDVWCDALGYGVAPPAAVAKLHKEVPLAAYDCAMVTKALRPPRPA